ncbi:MAG: hypothetical protein ACXVMS_02085 [Flavisolibacter sp.]
MKRIIITLSVLFTLATSYSFASEVKVSHTVLQAFQSRFSDAENVQWSQANGFTVAAFTIDDQKQYAYFNTAGELTVVAEPLTVKQLSKSQKANLEKSYGDYTVTDAYKLEDNDGTKYYVVVENSSKRIILSTSANKWEVVKSSAK